jgi:hypothetical protein
MDKSGRDTLDSVLFEDGTELVNVKFFPGTGRGLSAETLSSEAAKALRSAKLAWDASEPSKAPFSGRAKQPIIA